MQTTQDALKPAHRHACPKRKRTTARCDFPNAMVVLVGDEHIAARIDGDAVGIAEAGIGPETV